MKKLLLAAASFLVLTTSSAYAYGQGYGYGHWNQNLSPRVLIQAPGPAVPTAADLPAIPNLILAVTWTPSENAGGTEWQFTDVSGHTNTPNRSLYAGNVASGMKDTWSGWAVSPDGTLASQVTLSYQLNQNDLMNCTQDFVVFTRWKQSTAAAGLSRAGMMWKTTLVNQLNNDLFSDSAGSMYLYEPAGSWGYGWPSGTISAEWQTIAFQFKASANLCNVLIDANDDGVFEVQPVSQTIGGGGVPAAGLPNSSGGFVLFNVSNSGTFPLSGSDGLAASNQGFLGGSGPFLVQSPTTTSADITTAFQWFNTRPVR